MHNKKSCSIQTKVSQEWTDEHLFSGHRKHAGRALYLLLGTWLYLHAYLN
jgi:hypothetical protein